MYTVTWSNGHTDKARTWRELFDHVRATQWHDFTEDEFRAEMAKRAWRWSGTTIDMGAGCKRFFMELERAHMLLVGDTGFDIGKPLR